MCTITVLRLRDAHSYRVVMNRDESRQRPRAVPPTLVREKGVVALHPVDIPSRGTWIAVNESGLCLCLLNANPTPAPLMPAALLGKSYRSRGELIPMLIHHAAAQEALAELLEKDLQAYPPFRMLAVDEQSTCLLTSTHGARPAVEALASHSHFMLASSGLGDCLVTSPRERLFQEMVSNEEVDPATLQDAYHEHTWPGKEHISVLMSRKEARTVSTTSVLLQRTSISMQYREILETPENPVLLHQPLVISRTLRSHSPDSAAYL